MRKLFSILSVALLALSAHATVVTHNFDLSQFSNYGTATVSGGTITDAAAWNGAQLWEWTEGASNYDQVVLEVASHTEKILFRVQYSDETEVQKELPAGTNSMAIDIEQDIIKGIIVLNWCESSDIDITITGLYMRGAIGNKKNVTLWSGTKTFEDFSWENRLLMNAEDFADLHVGDILEVYYSTNAESYHQFDIKTDHDNKYPSFAPEQISLGGSNESGVLRFYIADATDLNNIASKGGLYLDGKYITFTKVSVIKHEVLWTGVEVVEADWQNYQDIPASRLSDLQIGNIICVRVTAIGSTDDGPRVSLFSGWSNSDALVGGEYYFQNTDAASAENPFIVQFPVTGSMKQQLGNKNLLIRGVNYTMTDVYVLEGDPVAESGVKGYLTVSAAGMATFMLPFNVPSLPEGVQAYNLTNNGDATIWATEVDALEADKPVLIVAAEGEYEFISEEGASDDISSKTGTYTNGALVGTYTTIEHLAQTTGGNYNYVLNNQGGNVAFYQVRDNSCSVAPYRAYLSCGYDASDAGPSQAPMRIVFHKDTTTGVENVQGDKLQSTKVFENGVLYIKHNGIKYNIQGQLCK
jgi:hypothetical protein